MIESGFSLWAMANPALRPLLGRSETDVAQNIYSAFYYSFLGKNDPTPGIVLDRLKSPDAEDTLDPRTAAPGAIIQGFFQFGSVAQNDPKNPVNASGYLSAALLSQALRRQLEGMANGNSALPDGTLIKDLWIVDEYDAHYEVGGMGYLFRRILHIGTLFQETS
jgi:hypothetical protein